MRAAWYERNGPAREVLVAGEMPDPEPGPGEVRVRIAVSGVNPSDWKGRMGGNRPMVAPRVIPHSDGAGVIDKVGAGVPASRVGERVWTWNAQYGRAFGTAAEYCVLPSEQAVRLPDGASFEVGAAMGIPALTAYRAVTTDGGVKGQSVLVAGGAGAVAQYAIQMAKLLGAAKVLSTVSSPAKAEKARGAGADIAIDYRAEKVAERVMAETGGLGVDRVIEVDMAGNAALVPAILVRDGLCVAYGTNNRDITIPFGPYNARGVAVRFFVVYELVGAARQEGIDAVNRWLAADALRHDIHPERFSLARTAEAHEAVEKGAVGKVLITV